MGMSGPGSTQTYPVGLHDLFKKMAYRLEGNTNTSDSLCKKALKFSALKYDSHIHCMNSISR